MFKEVVVVEFCIAFCLSLTTLLLRYFIHRRRSIRAMWKVCPVLCALLLLVIPRALFDLFVAVLWSAAAIGALANEPRNAYLLATSVLIEIAIDCMFSAVTIAIFLQRIFYLLFPTRRIRKFNVVVFTILGASTIGCAIVNFALILSNLSPDERPLPPGLQFIHTTAALSSGVILAIGTFMFVLIYRHRKQRQNETSVKVSKFVLYVFYIRVVFQTIPFVLDLVLTLTAGIHLGTFLGPYGDLGAILDITATTAVYDKLFKHPKKIANGNVRSAPIPTSN